MTGVNHAVICQRLPVAFTLCLGLPATSCQKLMTGTWCFLASRYSAKGFGELSDHNFHCLLITAFKIYESWKSALTVEANEELLEVIFTLKIKCLYWFVNFHA